MPHLGNYAQYVRRMKISGIITSSVIAAYPHVIALEEDVNRQYFHASSQRVCPSEPGARSKAFSSNKTIGPSYQEHQLGSRRSTCRASIQSNQDQVFGVLVQVDTVDDILPQCAVPGACINSACKQAGAGHVAQETWPLRTNP